LKTEPTIFIERLRISGIKPEELSLHPLSSFCLLLHYKPIEIKEIDLKIENKFV